MNTSEWGPSAWDTIHTIVANSSVDRIDPQSRENYFKYFDSLSSVLPCRYCRDSFCVFLHFFPLRSFCKKQLDFSYWAYTIHCLVNEKLGKPNNVDFFFVVCKYEKLRVKNTDKTNTHPTRNECDEIISKYAQKIKYCRARFGRYMDCCAGDDDDVCRRKAYGKLAAICRRRKEKRNLS